MSKRANGEGTICKHNKGGWVCAISLGYDEFTGKAKRKYIYGKTQKEVKQKLEQVKTDIVLDNYVDVNDLRVSRWVDIWFNDYCTHLKPKTATAYKSIINNHIIPKFRRIKLQDLKPHQLQRFINSIDKSPKTIKNIYGVFNKALNKAMQLKYIKSNPFDNITLPKQIKPEIRAFTDEELKLIFDKLKDNEYYPFYKFALYTGLRRGELLGLTWDCIDFKNGYMRVYRQLQIVNGKYVFITPKSNKSRTVALPQIAIDILKELKDNESDFVFSNVLGEHLSYYQVGHIFRNTIKSLDIPLGSLHDLRHTYAINCLRAGDNIKSLQENLGHATPQFTLERYATITTDMMKETRRKLDNHFSNLGV